MPDGLRVRSELSLSLSSIPTPTSRSVNTQRTLQLRLDAEPCDSCRAHSRCTPVLARPGQRPPAPEQWACPGSTWNAGRPRSETGWSTASAAMTWPAADRVITTSALRCSVCGRAGRVDERRTPSRASPHVEWAKRAPNEGTRFIPGRRRSAPPRGSAPQPSGPPGRAPSRPER